MPYVVKKDVGVVRLFLIFATVIWAADPAKELVKRAATAEKEGRATDAYLLYSQAAAADPSNQVLWAKAGLLKAPAVSASLQATAPVPEKEVELDSSLFGAISDKEVREAREMLPPPLLQPTKELRSFELHDGGRKLFERVAKDYGYEVTFDSDYPIADSAYRFKLIDANYRDALRALSLATGSFIVPLGPKRFMVAKDTQQKRQELEPTVLVTLSLLEPVAVQDLQEMARAVQQMMELQRFVIDNTRKLVLIRDRISKVRPAQQILTQMLRMKAEVEIDIELLEFSSSHDLNYGMTLPNRTQLIALGKPLHTVFTPSGVLKLATFGGASSLIGLSLSSMDMFATMSQSYSKKLLRASLRSDHGMPVTFHIGDRYPIISAGYFGDAIPGASKGDGITYRPPPSFTFEDLGLTLKVTPVVHGVDDISLEVEAEFKLLSGANFNGIPVVSNRKFTSRLRLEQGEWAVMTGLVSVSEGRTISGVAGLMQIPILGTLFSSNSKQETLGETLLLIRPRLLSLPPSEWATDPVWTGPEGRPEIPF